MQGQEVRDAIDKWFNENLRNGPVARNTETYNQVSQAVEKLKDQVAPVAAAPVAAAKPTPQQTSEE